MTPADKAKRTLTLIEIPRDELAYRLMVVATNMRPPPNMTATEWLTVADRAAPGMTRTFRAQADAAVQYFHQCIAAGVQPS